MLNEKLEFECYLSGNRKDIPLYNDTAKDNFSGIRRPLQVLARGFLEKCSEAGLPPTKAITACKSFLYIWMVGESDVNLPADLPLPQRELCLKAAENSFLQFANQVNTADQTEKVRNKAKHYMYSPFSKTDLTKKSNFNEIKFDYIIADALYAGPLQNCCLALKTGNHDKTLGIVGNEKNRKIALAVVGYILQHRARIGSDPQRTFIPVIQPEIGNWVHTRAQKSSSNSEGAISVAGAIESVSVSETGEPLFEKISGENYVKIRANPDWLSRFDVQLIPAEKEDQYLNQGYRVFHDPDLLVKRRK